jgi:hypothetical protein
MDARSRRRREEIGRNKISSPHVPAAMHFGVTAPIGH